MALPIVRFNLLVVSWLVLCYLVRSSRRSSSTGGGVTDSLNVWFVGHLVQLVVLWRCAIGCMVPFNKSPRLARVGW